ncbi:MAG: enoyl-CoA hydratase [Frankiales bacterium]|nr:enoyl-CoA hydratase [Frankiales bacterium]
MTGAPVGFVVADHGPVRVLRLSRPERLNAVTDTMLDSLADHVERAPHGVRCLVLTGEGRAFCSGADLQPDGSDPDGSTSSAGVATVVAGNRLVRALRDTPLPVVAALNGATVGIGVSVALACDLVVAADSAYVLLPFTGIGLLPDGGATALVAASVGRALALSLTLRPRRVAAEEALRMGLLHEVVAGDELDRHVLDLAQALADGSGAALAATKRAVNAATLQGLDDALERELREQAVLVQGADFAEAVAAFREKRPPRFHPGG